MQKDQAGVRHSYLKQITSTLLKKFVSPISDWASNTEIKFRGADTCTFTLVLIKPLEEMELPELEQVLRKYKAALSIDMITRLDREKIVQGSSIDANSSFTQHDWVPTIKGESKTFKTALDKLFNEEWAIEEARSKPYILQLYKVAHDDIRHKFFHRYFPVMMEIIEKAGGSVVMQQKENNPAIVDFEITMPDNCIRNLFNLLYIRIGTQVTLLDHAALLNFVLPPENKRKDNGWRQSQVPGYCFERVISKADHVQFFGELNELRAALGISFLDLSTLKTTLIPDSHNFAIAQIELSSIAQMQVLMHLHPGAIMKAARQLLDGMAMKYNLQLIGPLSFKLTIPPIDPREALERNRATIIDFSSINEKINVIAERYQLSVTECEGSYFFKARNLMPKITDIASVVANNNQASPKKECSLSLDHKKSMISNISKMNSKFKIPALSRLLIPLKLSFQNQEELEAFKSKFEEYLLQILINSDNIQDLTPKRIQDLAQEFLSAQNKSPALTESSMGCLNVSVDGLSASNASGEAAEGSSDVSDDSEESWCDSSEAVSAALVSRGL